VSCPEDCGCFPKSLCDTAKSIYPNRVHECYPCDGSDHVLCCLDRPCPSPPPSPAPTPSWLPLAIALAVAAAVGIGIGVAAGEVKV
jgi:hypothetical protein